MSDGMEKIRGMFARTLEAEGPEPRFVADEMLEELRRENAELREGVAEAIQQIEYLHWKFHETGTGNAVLARLRALNPTEVDG